MPAPPRGGMARGNYNGGGASGIERPPGVCFEASTQFRFWTFTPEGLAALRGDTHTRALAEVAARNAQAQRGDDAPEAAPAGAGGQQGNSPDKMVMSPAPRKVQDQEVRQLLLTRRVGCFVESECSSLYASCLN